MNKIIKSLALLLISICTACGDRGSIEAKSVIIAAMGEESGYTKNKFHTPTQFHTLLIRNIKDTTLFMEWETSPEKYYNYKVGDTILMDYKLHFNGMPLLKEHSDDEDHWRFEKWFHIKTKK